VLQAPITPAVQIKKPAWPRHVRAQPEPAVAPPMPKTVSRGTAKKTPAAPGARSSVVDLTLLVQSPQTNHCYSQVLVRTDACVWHGSHRADLRPVRASIAPASRWPSGTRRKAGRP